MSWAKPRVDVPAERRGRGQNDTFSALSCTKEYWIILCSVPDLISAEFFSKYIAVEVHSGTEC